MSKNWLRHFELQILNEQGKGISLSEFKVEFKISWADTESPRAAIVTIYNLSPQTNNRIMGEEFSKIRLIAGYDGPVPIVAESDVGKVTEVKQGQEGQVNGTNYGVIFEGDIRFTIVGKSSESTSTPDSWIKIHALGDYKAYLYGSLNTTLAAGYTCADLHRLAMKSWEPFGVTPGITGEMSDTVFPRGIPLYHSTRDVMNDIADMCNASWQMVDGKVQLVPVNKYIHEPIVLNSSTGLIGAPNQTLEKGINVKCLINPNIRINGLVKIDEASISREPLNDKEIFGSSQRIRSDGQGGYTNLGRGEKNRQAIIATDGVYIVKSIDYDGDTRGKNWYMSMICVALGDTTLLENQMGKK